MRPPPHRRRKFVVQASSLPAAGRRLKACTTNFATERSPRRLRRGLSMVEALISLAVCSMLLAAAGVAFNAAAVAVQVNADFSKSAQTARVTMSQMLTEARRADSVQCSAAAAATYFDVIRPAEMLTANEVYRRYSYDTTNKRLTLQIFYAGGTSGTLYVLASNVTAASFGPAQTGTDAAGQTAVQRVPVAVTVKVGKSAVTLNGAATPRRALSN